MKQQHRIHALTGIRAVAAAMVFLYHNRKFWHNDVPNLVMRFFNEFHTGVSIFFVLSGFLIAYTYKDRPLQSNISYWKYLLIRSIRIFPVYLMILTAKYVDVGFPSAKESFLTYSLFYGFSDMYNLNGISQGWTLTAEMSFYTLAPVIYYFTKRSIAKTLVYLLLLLSITLAAGYAWHLINGNKDGFFYPWFFVLNTTFFGRFFEFWCGMLLAHYFNVNPLNQRKLKYATLIGGIACLGIIYLISCFEPNIFKHGTDQPIGLAIRNIVFPCAVCIFLYGLITERTWLQYFLGSKILVLLGNASFVFYLIHIGYVARKIWAIHMFADYNFCILWIVSILIYLLIEKPIYSFLKSKIQHYNYRKPIALPAEIPLG